MAEYTLAELVVGDRVTRPRDLFEDRDVPNLRRGTVVEIYTDSASQVHQQLRLYAVCWDDTKAVEVGYLRQGLTKVARDV